MIEKAAGLPVDEVFFDLEDAVSASEKSAARELVIQALNSERFTHVTRTVRVNDATTATGYTDIVDLVLHASGSFDCLLLPKIVQPSQIHFVSHLVDVLEAQLGTGFRAGLEVLIETPAAAIQLTEIAAASPRIEALIFGPGDYATSLKTRSFDFGVPSPTYPYHQWHWVMSEIAAVAHAYGLDPIDGPYVDIQNVAGYLDSARWAKALGFRGKWCLHPLQVEPANATFSVTDEEASVAAGLLTAFSEAAAEGRGAVMFHGRMIDAASKTVAQQILADQAAERTTAQRRTAIRAAVPPSAGCEE